MSGHWYAGIAVGLWLGGGLAITAVYVGLCKTVRACQARKARRQATLRAHLKADAELLFPGSDSPVWPDECDPDEPCRTTFDNDADRGHFHPCRAHMAAEGRHHKRVQHPANRAVILADVALWEDELRPR